MAVLAPELLEAAQLEDILGQRAHADASVDNEHLELRELADTLGQVAERTAIAQVEHLERRERAHLDRAAECLQALACGEVVVREVELTHMCAAHFLESGTEIAHFCVVPVEVRVVQLREPIKSILDHLAVQASHEARVRIWLLAEGLLLHEEQEARRREWRQLLLVVDAVLDLDARVDDLLPSGREGAVGQLVRLVARNVLEEPAHHLLKKGPAALHPQKPLVGGRAFLVRDDVHRRVFVREPHAHLVLGAQKAFQFLIRARVLPSLLVERAPIDEDAHITHPKRLVGRHLLRERRGNLAQSAAVGVGCVVGGPAVGRQHHRHRLKRAGTTTNCTGRAVGARNHLEEGGVDLLELINGQDRRRVLGLNLLPAGQRRGRRGVVG